MSTEGKPKVITRRVAPEDLRDLLASPPRANLAFVENGRVNALSVDFRYEDERYWIAAENAPAALIPGVQVHLLIDDGEFHTQLRGIAMSGHIAGRPHGAHSADTSWLEVLPKRITAWHYGAMRIRK